jgi:hypothetical protein
VRNALQFARESRVKVSIAGVRHSMGGHAFARNAIVLDMTRFNRMSLDAEQRVLTVQAGATWHDIQTYLHPRFAVKAMQSTDIFTVGGSISVNAHGEGAFLPAVPTPLHARAARALVPRAPRVLPGEAGERPRRTPDEHVLRKVLPLPRHRRTLSRSILMRHKRRKDLTRPGGFAPPDPLSPSLAGTPSPRSAPARRACGAPTRCVARVRARGRPTLENDARKRRSAGTLPRRRNTRCSHGRLRSS